MTKSSKSISLTAILTLALAFSSCTSIPAYKQQLVSKAGMTFSDSLVENAQSSLTPQVEPGSDSSGGAQASGCSACR